MALIKCPECGKEISDKASACIHCGYPLASENIIKDKEIQSTDTKPTDIVSIEREDIERISSFQKIKPFYLFENRDDSLLIECGNCQKVYVFKKNNFYRWSSNFCACKIPFICPNCNNGVEANISINKRGYQEIKEAKHEEIKSQNTCVPKCPTCKSTNIRKISGASKVGSVAIWGIFAAGKVSKQWHCNNCGSEW